MSMRGAYYESGQNSNMYILLGALLNMIVYLACAIVFIMWFRRAYHNLHQMRISGLVMSEGWAAGAWFIPIYNLWGPFNIAVNLFKKTEEILVENKLTVVKRLRHRVVANWWFLWIVVGILGVVESQLTKMTLHADEPEIEIAAIYSGLLASILAIPMALLAIKMIKNYSKMEELLPKIEGAKGGYVDVDPELLDSNL